jgi:hypothetical protein
MAFYLAPLCLIDITVAFIENAESEFGDDFIEKYFLHLLASGVYRNVFFYRIYSFTKLWISHWKSIISFSFLMKNPQINLKFFCPLYCRMCERMDNRRVELFIFAFFWTIRGYGKHVISYFISNYDISYIYCVIIDVLFFISATDRNFVSSVLNPDEPHAKSAYIHRSCNILQCLRSKDSFIVGQVILYMEKSDFICNNFSVRAELRRLELEAPSLSEQCRSLLLKSK